MIGVAVGSQDLKLVRLGQEPLELPYNKVGLNQILEARDQDGKVLLSGNRRWAEALVCSLHAQGVEVRYVGSPKKKAGEKLNNAKLLKMALETGFIGQLFLIRETTIRFPAQEESSHPWVQLANEYDLANDDIRRAKHRVLDCLRTIFPELLALEQKLWGKKILYALRQLDWQFFLKHELCYADSLGQNVSETRRKECERKLLEELTQLQLVEEKKEERKEKIIGLMENHPVTQAYNGSFSAMLVLCFVAWRSWGTNKKSRLALQHFAGLVPKMLDAKGKRRISGERPLIRVNLYHLLKTTRGQEVVQAAADRLGKRLGKAVDGDIRKSMKLVERLEYILRDIWSILKQGELNQAETASNSELLPVTSPEVVAS